jgi:hypothetical protein
VAAEAVRTAESVQIEEKVVYLHIVVRKKGLSSTGEVTKRGGVRRKG